MDRSVLLAIVVVFMVALLALLVLGWRARVKRQSGIAKPARAPQDAGEILAHFTGKYVATTSAGDQLDRVAVHGLGFRGSVSIDVHRAGLLVAINGADEFFIPAQDMRGIGTATWTIDRVVEKDGLDRLEWTLGDKHVDSYFRLDNAAAFEKIVATLTERKPA